MGYYTRVGRPAKSYIHLHCADSGFALEELARAIAVKDWLQEREREGGERNMCCSHALMIF